MTLSDTLMRHRLERGLNQSQFAKLLGITQGHYSKIERKEQRISRKLRAVCEIYLAKQEAQDLHLNQGLETAALNAMRGSPEFRRLVDAALKMHKRNK